MDKERLSVRKIEILCREKSKEKEREILFKIRDRETLDAIGQNPISVVASLP